MLFYFFFVSDFIKKTLISLQLDTVKYNFCFLQIKKMALHMKFAPSTSFVNHHHNSEMLKPVTKSPLMVIFYTILVPSCCSPLNHTISTSCGAFLDHSLSTSRGAFHYHTLSTFHGASL